MPSTPPLPPLDPVRRRVVARVRELRTARRWTQAELARRLGLSQARLSEIERGGGSFTAEQLLEILRLFNVGVEEFAAPQPVEDELQNALARLGALHLREVAGTLPSARVGSVIAAVRETLLEPKDARLLLALAPVILANLDALNLDVLHDDLTRLGFPSRVPWLVENTLAALDLRPTRPSVAAARRALRARTILGHFLARHPAPTEEPTPDFLDPTIRSETALADTLVARSPTSRRWGVISDLHPSDFADALEAADVAG